MDMTVVVSLQIQLLQRGQKIFASGLAPILIRQHRVDALTNIANENRPHDAACLEKVSQEGIYPYAPQKGQRSRLGEGVYSMWSCCQQLTIVHWRLSMLRERPVS